MDAQTIPLDVLDISQQIQLCLKFELSSFRQGDAAGEDESVGVAIPRWVVR